MVTFHLHLLVAPVNQIGRISASYYIDGPNDLRKLQSSYAVAMKVHGLERGVQKSSAHHEDIKRLYGELNKASLFSALS